MLLIVGILFSVIFIYKGISHLLSKHYFATLSRAVTVSTTTVNYADWQPKIKAVGNTVPVLGVNITTELAGMVKTIYFTPGDFVQKGTVLVQLNADTEIGQLHALIAQAAVAKITWDRDQLQYKAHAVSKQQVDTDEYNYKNLVGQVEGQTATVAKKTITAPFTGRLGISVVYPGQYLNVGDTVTTLQALDPIYVNFYVPQQNISMLSIGEHVTMTVDSFPNKIFNGTITTIEPILQTQTRNVQVQATIPNPDLLLKPNMFAYIEIDTGTPQKYLTLPQAAITYNSYGDLVYIVNQKDKDDKKSALVVKQSFVTVGETRGDQTTILKGLKAGDVVVTSGMLKLKNNSEVNINNSVLPSSNPNPQVANEK